MTAPCRERCVTGPLVLEAQEAAAVWLRRDEGRLGRVRGRASACRCAGVLGGVRARAGSWCSSSRSSRCKGEGEGAATKLPRLSAFVLLAPDLEAIARSVSRPPRPHLARSFARPSLHHPSSPSSSPRPPAPTSRPHTAPSFVDTAVRGRRLMRLERNNRIGVWSARRRLSARASKASFALGSCILAVFDFSTRRAARTWLSSRAPLCNLDRRQMTLARASGNERDGIAGGCTRTER